MNLQFIFLVATNTDADIVPTHSSHLDTKSVDVIPTHTPTITQSGVDVTHPGTIQTDTTALQTDIIIAITGGAVAVVVLISITSAVTFIMLWLKMRTRKNPTRTQERYIAMDMYRY